MCSSSGASGSSGVLSMLIGLRAAHGQIGGACSLLCSARSFFGAATRSGSLSATLLLGGVLGEVNAVHRPRRPLREDPNPMALLQMSQSEEYQAIHHHRAAGLEGQVNYAVVQTGGA